jgi:hypothetical protein
MGSHPTPSLGNAVRLSWRRGMKVRAAFVSLADRQGSLPELLFSSISWALVRCGAGQATRGVRSWTVNLCEIRVESEGFCREIRIDSRPCPPPALRCSGSLGSDGKGLSHPSHLCQIGESDQDPIATSSGSLQSLPHRMVRVAFLTELLPKIRPSIAAGFPAVDRNSARRRARRWGVQ